MDGFDPAAMSYLAPNPAAHAAAAMHGLQNIQITNQDLMLPMDTLSNYENETFIGSEDASQYGHHSMQPPLTPSIKRFSNTYEDGFSDQLSQYEQSVAHEQTGVDSPNIERDHRLLGFSMPNLPLPILDFAGRRTNINISSQLHGMFFLAESPWANASEGAAPPAELTCYRRNLFQVTGNVMLPKGLRYVVTEQGEQRQVMGQELVISATESVEKNAVKIISVPWKTPATSAPVEQDKTEKEPTTIPLDIASGQEIDAEYTSIPIAWKRLQFRSATANNGRRKELQQHFVVHLKVMATLDNGEKLSLAEVVSNAIIVRGRSPRNFQSRKDLPISGSASAARKNHSVSAMPQISRTSTGDSSHVQLDHRPMTTGIDIPKIPFAYDTSDHQMSPDFFEWQIPTGQMDTMTSLPEPGSFAPHENGNGAVFHGTPYAQSTPDLSRARYMQDNSFSLGGGNHHTSNHRHTLSVPRAPINLSLTDDLSPSPSSIPAQPVRRSPTSAPAPTLSQIHLHQVQQQQHQQHHNNTNGSTGMCHVKKAPRLSQTPSFSINLLSSPEESSADLLYEYFPLGLDDWMPPVDAVYRPHVVHHTNLPADPGAGMKSGFFGGAGVVGGVGVGGGGAVRAQSVARSKRHYAEEGGAHG